MIKVLVTGAEGQIAKELHEISTIIENPTLEFIFFTKKDWDITNNIQSKYILDQYKPQYLINTAAYTKVDLAETEKEKCFLINTLAPTQLASICKEIGTRFVHFSSDYIFDNSEYHQPIDENESFAPKGIYAQSKALAEKEILQANNESIILRCSWIYSSYGHNFVKTMLRLSKEKQELSIVNDQIGSPTYAANIAELLLDIILFENLKEKKLSGIFHYSNEGSTTWLDFAKFIFEQKGIQIKLNPITSLEFNAAAPRPMYSVLDCSKIKNNLHISIPNWRESLKLCLTKLN